MNHLFIVFPPLDSLPVDASHAVAVQEPLVMAEILVGLKFHIDYGRRIEIGLILDDELAESTVASGFFSRFFLLFFLSFPLLIVFF